MNGLQRLAAVGLAALLGSACAGGPLGSSGESVPNMDWPSTRQLAAAESAWDSSTPQMRLAAARVIDDRLEDFRFLRMETFESGDAEHEVALFEHEPTGMEFSLVPGGLLAADHGERFVSAGYLMARTEVTQRVWEEALGTNPSALHDGNRPVEGVTWTDATGFCRQLGLELPTSTQWELACRAGTVTRFSFGDDVDDLPEHAWYRDNTDGSTKPVARLAPNAWGLFDVHGNVREWCRDRVGGYGVDARRSLALRIVRGGGWNYTHDLLGSNVRNWGTPDSHSTNIGLRPVRSLAGH